MTVLVHGYGDIHSLSPFCQLVNLIHELLGDHCRPHKIGLDLEFVAAGPPACCLPNNMYVWL